MSEKQKQNIKDLIEIALTLDEENQKSLVRFGHDLIVIDEVKRSAKKE